MGRANFSLCFLTLLFTTSTSTSTMNGEAKRCCLILFFVFQVPNEFEYPITHRDVLKMASKLRRKLKHLWNAVSAAQ